MKFFQQTRSILVHKSFSQRIRKSVATAGTRRGTLKKCSEKNNGFLLKLELVIQREKANSQFLQCKQEQNPNTGRKELLIKYSGTLGLEWRTIARRCRGNRTGQE